eukprot:COSAG01_NODE_1598_length_9772_cov_8.388671_4_plen_227_part_00
MRRVSQAPASSLPPAGARSPRPPLGHPSAPPAFPCSTVARGDRVTRGDDAPPPRYVQALVQLCEGGEQTRRQAGRQAGTQSAMAQRAGGSASLPPPAHISSQRCVSLALSCCIWDCEASFDEMSSRDDCEQCALYVLGAHRASEMLTASPCHAHLGCVRKPPPTPKGYGYAWGSADLELLVQLSALRLLHHYHILGLLLQRAAELLHPPGDDVTSGVHMMGGRCAQ